MNSALWPSFLLWAAILNYGVLILSFAGFVFAHDAMYRLHRRWFDLSVAQFDAALYFLFGLYKLGIWFFLLVPYLVLCYLN
jgi:uncharacterized protein DUF6868